MKTVKGFAIGIAVTCYELAEIIGYVIFLGTCLIIGLCRENIAEH